MSRCCGWVLCRREETMAGRESKDFLEAAIGSEGGEWAFEGFEVSLRFLEGE